MGPGSCSPGVAWPGRRGAAVAARSTPTPPRLLRQKIPPVVILGPFIQTLFFALPLPANPRSPLRLGSPDNCFAWKFGTIKDGRTMPHEKYCHLLRRYRQRDRREHLQCAQAVPLHAENRQDRAAPDRV